MRRAASFHRSAGLPARRLGTLLCAALASSLAGGAAAAQPVVAPCEPVQAFATADLAPLARFNLAAPAGRSGCGLAELVGAWSPFGLAVMRSGHLQHELRLVVNLPALASGPDGPGSGEFSTAGGARPGGRHPGAAPHDGAQPGDPSAPATPRYIAWIATPALDRIERLGPVTPGQPFFAPVHWNKIVLVVSLEDAPPAPDAPRWSGPVVLLGRSRSALLANLMGHSIFRRAEM